MRARAPRESAQRVARRDTRARTLMSRAVARQICARALTLLFDISGMPLWYVTALSALLLAVVVCATLAPRHLFAATMMERRTKYVTRRADERMSR